MPGEMIMWREERWQNQSNFTITTFDIKKNPKGKTWKWKYVR